MYHLLRKSGVNKFEVGEKAIVHRSSKKLAQKWTVIIVLDHSQSKKRSIQSVIYAWMIAKKLCVFFYMRLRPCGQLVYDPGSRRVFWYPNVSMYKIKYLY